MFEDEMPESDSSDEDFVPTGDRSDVSEEESDDAVEEKDIDQNVTNKRKKTRTKSNNAGRKRGRKDLDDENEDDEPLTQVKEVNVEDKKKRADALWADFLKDSGPAKKSTESPKCKPSVSSKTLPEKSPQDTETDCISEPDNLSESLESCERTENVAEEEDMTEDQGSSNKVVEVYEFAGEKVLVEKKMDPRKKPVSRGGGVSALLNQINKKSKLSTLEKSKLDWDSFKQNEGITEQLTAHNKGKNGYLEKQDFLERADLRQFEIEKQMRAYSRSKRV